MTEGSLYREHWGYPYAVTRKHITQQTACTVQYSSDQQARAGAPAATYIYSIQQQWLKQATFGGREGDTSPHHDMVMLHRIVHALANSSSLITLETGFANGGSTVAILAAHDAHGTHVSDGRLRGGFDCEEVASRWRGGGEEGSTEAARWQ